jgi:hypothetical protein
LTVAQGEEGVLMSISSVSKGANAVRAQYEFRVQSLRDQIDALRMRRRWPLLAVFTGCAVSAVLLIAALSGDKFLFAVLTVPAIAMVWGLRSLLRSRAKSIALARRSSFYERGIDRLEDNWRGKGNTGTVFMRDHHLYQSDLDILGEGSV